MIRLTVRCLMLCLVGVLANDVHAAIVIDIDMDTVQPGVQRSRAAATGEEFPIEIFMTTDDAGVSSYSVSLQFDNAELAIGTAPVELLPTGFVFHLGAGVTHFNDVGTGWDQISSFDAATFGVGPTNTTFSLGTIGFRVLADNNDGETDIIPGFFAPADQAFDNAVPGQSLTQTAVLNGGSITTIPEPTAIVLLSVLCLCTSLRRRKGRTKR